MADATIVKVLEICHVSPPPGSVPQTSLPLTFFDLFWLPLPPPECLYFYEFPLSKTHFHNSLLPRIKHSLSLTLQHFYPLAGNLIWPLDSKKPFINYIDGDSVSLTIAESDSDFHHLSGHHPKVADQSHPLVPNLPVTGEIIPIMALQLTLFPNSGICIGVTIHHAVVDGKMFFHFITSWASVCRFGDMASLTVEMIPSYDKSLIEDPNGLESIYLNNLLDFFHSLPESESESKFRRFKVLPLELSPNMVRAKFEFSHGDIAELKKIVSGRSSNGKQIHVSTFVLTTAYVLICLIKVRRGKKFSDDNFFLRINADLRARLSPPIPLNYFGNCIGGRTVSSNRNDLLMGRDGFVKAVNLLGEAIKGMEDGALNGAEEWLSRLLTLRNSNQFRLAAAGTPRFRVYETDFGWGKPKIVELISIDKTGAVFFTESVKEDNGVEFGLVLNKEEMETFASVFTNGLNDLKSRL